MTPRGIVLDLFGTLLDVSSLREDVAGFVDDPEGFVRCWREKQVSYMLESAATGRYENFDRITAFALDYTASLFAVDLGQERDRMLAAWARMRPYDDAEIALRALRGTGLTLSVLTNATKATGEAALQAAGLSGSIDLFLSAESHHVLKPHPKAYEPVMAAYGLPASDFVFVTAAGWDAIGAAEIGMHVAWCNRGGAPPETFGRAPAWTMSSLRDLGPLLAKAAPSRS